MDLGAQVAQKPEVGVYHTMYVGYTKETKPTGHLKYRLWSQL